MSFELRITFSGLCLFVPEPAVGTVSKNRMHVLMPNPSHQHGADRHIPVIGFDAAYMKEGNNPRSKFIVQRVLRECVLNVGEGGASLEICPEIVNLKEVTAKSVDPDHLGADTKLGLASRVTLSSGTMSAVAPGVCWEWGSNRVRPIAHLAQWSIPMDVQPPLRLSLTKFDGTHVADLPPLYPIFEDGANLVNIFVHHLPAGEMQPEPDPASPKPHPGHQPHHFLAYYPLFGDPVPMRLPKLVGDSDCPLQETGPCTLLRDKGASAYNCMLAGAW